MGRYIVMLHCQSRFWERHDQDFPSRHACHLHVPARLDPVSCGGCDTDGKPRKAPRPNPSRPAATPPRFDK